MEHLLLEKLDEIKSILTGKTNNKLLKIDEVCRYSSISDSTIRRAVRRGTLKASASTGRLLFKKSDVDRWLRG